MAERIISLFGGSITIENQHPAGTRDGGISKAVCRVSFANPPMWDHLKPATEEKVSGVGRAGEYGCGKDEP